MADKVKAARLKQALRVAMTQKGIDDWIVLGQRSGVSYTTIENWIYGRTVPSPRKLRQVGDFLEPYTSAAALEAAYEGVEAAEPPIIDALRALLPELQELVILLRAQADQAVVEALQDALRKRHRGERGFLGEPPDEPSAGSEDRE